MAEGKTKISVMPFLWLIKAYRLLLSPWLGSTCRFNPSCSRYCEQAITQHGIVKGGYLSMIRLLKCHPWGGHGEDPVPPVKKADNIASK